jgi:hypothetical protein
MKSYNYMKVAFSNCLALKDFNTKTILSSFNLSSMNGYMDFKLIEYKV